MYSYFSRCHVTTNSVAPPPLCKPHTTHNSSICSDEGITLEMSAFRIPVWWPIYVINSVDKIWCLQMASTTCLHHLWSFARVYISCGRGVKRVVWKKNIMWLCTYLVQALLLLALLPHWLQQQRYTENEINLWPALTAVLSKATVFDLP